MDFFVDDGSQAECAQHGIFSSVFYEIWVTDGVMVQEVDQCMLGAICVNSTVILSFGVVFEQFLSTCNHAREGGFCFPLAAVTGERIFQCFVTTVPFLWRVGCGYCTCRSAQVLQVFQVTRVAFAVQAGRKKLRKLGT